MRDPTSDTAAVRSLGWGAHRARAQRWWWTAPVAVLVAGLVVRPWSARRVPPTLARLYEGGRSLEARVTFGEADVHHRFAPHPPALPPWAIHQMLGRFDEAGQRAAVVAGFLETGDREQASVHAQLLPESPDAESDRAAVELEAGRPAEALDLVERCGRAHPQALWNGALARTRLGLPLAAVSGWQSVAALGEPGWAAEARERGQALWAGQQERLARFRELQAAVAGLRDFYRVPPAATLARDPELWREQFYQVLRRAQTASRLDVLAGLAVALDRSFGGSVLEREVEAGRHGRLDRLSRTLEAPDLIDVDREVERGQLVAAIEQARRLDDGWLEQRAQGLLAVRDAIAGDGAGATERLSALVRRCLAGRLRRLCEEQRLWLAWVLDFRHMFGEATETSQVALHNLRASGDVTLERIALVRLGHHAAGQIRPGLVRAYLAEATAIAPESCEVRGLMVRLLANIAYRQGDLERVREEMKAGFGCAEHLGLAGANALRALIAAGGTHEEHELLDLTLRGLRRRGGLTPSRQLILGALEARLMAATPARMIDSLRLLRRQSLALPDDDWSETARLLLHLPLVADAIGRGDPREALGLFFAMYKGKPTDDGRCWLAMAIDGNDGLVIARAGGVRAAVVPAHRLLEPNHAWLDEGLRADLARCPSIDVLASGELYGRPGLLPPDWAWAYTGIEAPRTSARPATWVRLVVANVPAPAALRLPELSRWTVQPRPGSAVILRAGPAATPAEILRRLPEADEIDFHVHGRLAPEISAVTHLVLAPEPDGRYALTAEALRRVSLRGRAPVVLLAACEAGRKGAGARIGWSLPRAFLEAGARAVIAAPIDIPDAEAGTLFEEISDELLRTPGAAVAVQRVRSRHARQTPDGRSSWFDSIIVFEG